MVALRETPRAADPAPPTPPAAPSIADDEYVSGAQLKQFLQSVARDTSAVDIAASNTLGLARTQYAEDFRKYGPEIEAQLARVPRNLWTLDNVAQVVRMVRSDHLDEIAHERAQRLVAEMPATLRSTGGAPNEPPVAPEYSLESEKIPAEWKKRALAAGITEATIREFCAAEGMSVEAFYKQFETPMNRIVEDISTKQRAV